MTLEKHLGSWYSLLRYEFTKKYMKKVHRIVSSERQKFTVYPDSDEVFRAYRLTSLENVKVVILGQDPYPHRHANGLAFSTEESMEPIPKSLENIFKELESDLGFQIYHNPDLGRWAKQGVMLLNSVLTTRSGYPNGHKGIGWERFTSRTIELICKRAEPTVFILWGREAQRLTTDTIPNRHHIIYSPHPSPRSANLGFFGSKPFSRTNTFLEKHNREPIDWFKNE